MIPAVPGTPKKSITNMVKHKLITDNFLMIDSLTQSLIDSSNLTDLFK